MSEAKTSKRDWRRARLVASGWKPRQDNGVAMRSKGQEKMDTSPQAFQERCKPQKVQQQAQRKDMDVTKKRRKWLRTAEVLHVQVEDSVETSSCRGEAKTKPLSKNAKNIMKNTVV